MGGEIAVKIIIDNDIHFLYVSKTKQRAYRIRMSGNGHGQAYGASDVRQFPP